MINKNVEIQEYKEVDDEVIQIMASDESVDRDNDVIKVDGWNIDNWLKTGSLLYGHDPSSPYNVMGSAEGYEIKDGKLYLYSRLAKKGTSPTHDAVRSLIEQKILRGVSVGFKSTDYEANEHGGVNFMKQELLEISLTPVPANANAHVVKEFGKTCEELGISVEDKEVESTKDLSEENETLKKEISLQDKAMIKLMKQLDEQSEKYKELLKQFLSDDEEREETQAVEPEPNTLSKEQRFLDLIQKNTGEL